MKKIFSILTILLLLYATFAYAQGDITPLGISKLDGSTDINKLLLSSINEPATPTLAFGDGDTGIYEGTDDELRFSIAGTGIWKISTSLLCSRSYSKTGTLLSQAVTDTVPGFGMSNDTNTGIGSADDDILSLIAGGVEGIRITEAAGLISHILTGKVNTPTTQTLTGAGVVDITSAVTHLVTTAANALTLADGTDGQHKFIVMKTDGGTGTLTPTNPGNFATIVFDDVGDSAQLLFTNGKWHFMGGTATLT